MLKQPKRCRKPCVVGTLTFWSNPTHISDQYWWGTPFRIMMMEVLSKISCLKASFLCFVLWLNSTKGKMKKIFGDVFLKWMEFREKWRLSTLAKKKKNFLSWIGWKWTTLTLRRKAQFNTGLPARIPVLDVMTLSPPKRALRLGFGLLLKHWRVQPLAPKPASTATTRTSFWYACFALKLADVLELTQVNTIPWAASTCAKKSLLSRMILCVTTSGKMN